MKNFDLILENCRIQTTTHQIDGDIAIKGGKIVEVARSHKEHHADKRIDIDGKIVIPGCIDAHVHFRDPGQTKKGDFETESKSALFGGVTTVFDMPNTEPRVDCENTFEFKRDAIAGKSYVDYALYFEITDANCEKLPPAFAYKAYMDSGRVTVKGVQKALKKLEHKIVCVHPGNFGSINTKVYNRKKPETHSLVRNVGCEATGIKKLMRLNLGNNHMHFCHVSTGVGMGLIANNNDKNISCEVTPHHLLLDISTYATWGAMAKVNPPLRSHDNLNQLWASMINIDMIATDHAPHTRQDKEQMIMSACPGFAGVETMLPLMINEVNKGRMSWQQLVKLTSHGPMEIFGVVEKGEILAGKDADIVVIDNSVDWTIEPNELHSKCGWTIFEGTEIRGAVDKVFKGGDLVVDGVEFYGKKGSGREIGF